MPTLRQGQANAMEESTVSFGNNSNRFDDDCDYGGEVASSVDNPPSSNPSAAVEIISRSELAPMDSSSVDTPPSSNPSAVVDTSSYAKRDAQTPTQFQSPIHSNIPSSSMLFVASQRPTRKRVFILTSTSYIEPPFSIYPTPGAWSLDGLDAIYTPSQNEELEQTEPVSIQTYSSFVNSLPADATIVWNPSASLLRDEFFCGRCPLGICHDAKISLQDVGDKEREWWSEILSTQEEGWISCPVCLGRDFAVRDREIAERIGRLEEEKKEGGEMEEMRKVRERLRYARMVRVGLLESRMSARDTRGDDHDDAGDVG